MVGRSVGIGEGYTESVIPTLLLIGLVFGKWWRITIPATTVAWVVVLSVNETDSGVDFVFSAGAWAALNVTVGVLIFQGVRLLLRMIRTRAGVGDNV